MINIEKDKLENAKRYKVKNDLVFHHIFRHEDILKSFLSALLNIEIDSIEVGNDMIFSCNDMEYKDCIRAIINGNISCYMLTEKWEESDDIERIYFYLPEMPDEDLRKYVELTIDILNDELNENDNSNKIGLLYNYGTLSDSKYEIFEDHEVRLIMLSRLRKKEGIDLDNKLYQWLIFIDDEVEESVQEVISRNEEIKKANEIKEKFLSDEKQK